jgi:LAO/AO transport system kinase
VVVETVGVGQSETEVADVADSVAVLVQPGSGDALQFLKAGIMEVPDVLVVTKADLGPLAERSAADLRAAVRGLGRPDTPVVAVSALPPPRGIGELLAALDAHRAGSTCRPPGRPSAGRAPWPTSRPSTASAGCARSAGGAPPRACSTARPDLPTSRR